MSAPTIEVVETDDVTLTVQLEAKPPIVGTTYNGGPRHDVWTLDLMERTCFEFRSAGAWDGSQITLSGFPGSVKCEVLAGRGPDAMPWGWRPSEGPPAPPTRTPTMNRRLDDVVPAFLGSRVLHGVLLLALLVLAVVR